MSTMQEYELDAYLGDWANEVTDEQKRRLLALGDDLDEAGFAAAVAYTLGDLTPKDAGESLRRARRQAEGALSAARQVAVMAVEDGATEAGTARTVGIDRMTLRADLGKR